jgi:hypothetical protein
MNKQLFVRLAPLLAIAALAMMPVVAHAAETTTLQTRTLSSGPTNSLCVHPTEQIFKEPGATKPQYPPITTEHAGPFSEEKCGQKEPKYPFSGGEAGGTGFKYNEKPLYSSKIPGGQWVSPYENAEAPDTEQYFVYDAHFYVPCETSSIELNGTMLADNTAGAFLNGHAIGNDDVTIVGAKANFEKPTSFGGTKALAADFKFGDNILQFVVFNQGHFTALDFAATVKFTCGPVWFSNKKAIPVGKTEQTISWGKLTFQSPVGPVTCKKADAGNIWNPGRGRAGLDETVLFDLYECQAPECPKGVQVTASGLPWPTELSEVAPVGSKKFRDKIAGIRLTINCEGRVSTFFGTLTPTWVSKSSTAKPSFDEFGEGSGELVSEEKAKLTLTGNDYVRGFEFGDEVITVGSETSKEIKEREELERPVVKLVEPKEGGPSGGTFVTITGLNFSPEHSGVKFGESEATEISCPSSTQCTAVSPAHEAGTVDVTVTTTGGTSTTSAADQFTYVEGGKAGVMTASVGAVSPV